MSWVLGFPSPPPPRPHSAWDPQGRPPQLCGSPGSGGLGSLWSLCPCRAQARAPHRNPTQPPGMGCLPLRARRAGGQVDRPEGESWSQESLQVGHQGRPRLPARLSLESENLRAKGPQTPTCPTLSWCPDLLCTGPHLSLELPSLICVISGHLSLGRPPGPELETTRPCCSPAVHAQNLGPQQDQPVGCALRGPVPSLQLLALCTILFLLDAHQFISVPHKVWHRKTKMAKTLSASLNLSSAHPFLLPFPGGLSVPSQLSHRQTGHKPQWRWPCDGRCPAPPPPPPLPLLHPLLCSWGRGQQPMPHPGTA